MITLIFALKKAWAFLKRYWVIPALVLGTVILYLLFGSSASKRLTKLIKNIIDIHGKESEAIDKAYRKELEAKEKAKKEYDKKALEIEESHEKNLDKIEKEKALDIENLSKEPVDVLTDEIAKRLNAKVIKD